MTISTMLMWGSWGWMWTRYSTFRGDALELCLSLLSPHQYPLSCPITSFKPPVSRQPCCSPVASTQVIYQILGTRRTKPLGFALNWAHRATHSLQPPCLCCTVVWEGQPACNTDQQALG